MELQPSVKSFFVYGTLRSDQIRRTCWPRKPLCIRTAYAHGRLFDLGPYPAMTHGGNVIAGEQWEFEEWDIAPTLAVLDSIEGYRGVGQHNLYQREIIVIHATPDMRDSVPVSAYVYRMRMETIPVQAREIPASETNGGSTSRYARWPEGDLPASVTSILPDPFPDDVPPPPRNES